MDWADHTIWWHVYPLGFTGAPVRPTENERVLTHRLRHLVDWLDYAIEVGVNGLALGPIFASSTHGYDTVNHFEIDPRLGDEADFDALVAGCRQRGIKLMLDGVFNHVGTDHPLFRAAMDSGAHSHEAALFRIEGGDGSYATFEGHHDLAALNHDNTAVADLVVEIMLHWLRRGVTAWRLDAAYTVPASFWADVLGRVRVEFPNTWFLGEVIHGDYSATVRESGFDSCTQYELWKAIWSALADNNVHELDWALSRHNALLRSFTPVTFVSNHDVTRIASQLDDTRAAIAHLLLFTLGGHPTVYYGDEQGFHGVKTNRIGGDDEVRPAYPREPANLASWGAPTLRLHQDLIGLRRRHPWLTTARSETTILQYQHCVFEMIGTSGQRLRVEIDLRGNPLATLSSEAEELMRID